MVQIASNFIKKSKSCKETSRIITVYEWTQRIQLQSRKRLKGPLTLINLEMFSLKQPTFFSPSESFSPYSSAQFILHILLALFGTNYTRFREK